MFVRGYGIPCQRVRYLRMENQVRSKCCFCRIFSLDCLARAPEGCPKKRAFVGRYGNLLLQGTVFLWRGVRYLKAALFGAVLVGGYGITPASSSLENGSSSGNSSLLRISMRSKVGS